jgi:hypothetical protein
MAAIAAVACAAHDGNQRRATLASSAAHRFVGVWSVTLTTDSTSPARRLGLAPQAVSGTIVFVLDRSGPSSTAALDGVTHEGAYDLDLAPFGLATHAGSVASVAVARIAPVAGSHGRAAPGDSVRIVLNPDSDQFPLRMDGLFEGDSVVGTWSAYAFGTGGGAGRFVMHRPPAAAGAAHPDSTRLPPP